METRATAPPRGECILQRTWAAQGRLAARDPLPPLSPPSQNNQICESNHVMKIHSIYTQFLDILELTIIRNGDRISTAYNMLHNFFSLSIYIYVFSSSLTTSTMSLSLRQRNHRDRRAEPLAPPPLKGDFHFPTKPFHSFPRRVSLCHLNPTLLVSSRLSLANISPFLQAAHLRASSP